MQVDDDSPEGEQTRLLTRVDLGDLAAENEIRGLRHYFVETGQAVRARQGHARLVTGRKGTGKTAIFYDVRSAVTRGHDRLIIDLKPEGHQFLQLREALLDKLDRAFANTQWSPSGSTYCCQKLPDARCTETDESRASAR